MQFFVSLTALLGQGHYHVSVMRHCSDKLTVLGLYQLHHLHYQIIQVKRSGITSKNTIDLYIRTLINQPSFCPLSSSLVEVS